MFIRPLLLTKSQINTSQLYTSQINDSNASVTHSIDNVSPALRFALIKFLKSFCSEGMDEILKMEGLFYK